MALPEHIEDPTDLAVARVLSASGPAMQNSSAARGGYAV
jgi:hypothetical protein